VADPVPFTDRIGQEVSEHLQMGLVDADGGKRQIQDRALWAKNSSASPTVQF